MDQSKIFINFSKNLLGLNNLLCEILQLTKAAIFIAAPMYENLVVSISPKDVFCQFVDRKVVGLNAKVLPGCSNAGVTSQISIFS